MPNQLSFLPMPLREALARAIYARQPFCQASTVCVLGGLGRATVFSWEGAPASYQDQCFDLADAVIAEIYLRREQGEQPPIELKEPHQSRTLMGALEAAA